MIRRTGETIWLEGPCPVEDAEALLQAVQEGGAVADWSGCTLLHAACLQVLLAALLPVRGVPKNPALARWLAPCLPAASLNHSPMET
jgi:hypothetical protein